MSGSEFDRRWRRLVAVAREAPAPPLRPPSPRFARLPGPAPARPSRLRLAMVVGACAALYGAALPLVESALAAAPTLELSLPRPPALPALPTVRPPALPRPPRLPLSLPGSAPGRSSPAASEGADDPR